MPPLLCLPLCFHQNASVWLTPGTDAVNEWSVLAPTLFVLLHPFKQGFTARHKWGKM